MSEGACEHPRDRTGVFVEAGEKNTMTQKHVDGVAHTRTEYIQIMSLSLLLPLSVTIRNSSTRFVCTRVYHYVLL